MKKLLTISLILALTLAMTSCGDNSTPKTQADAPATDIKTDLKNPEYTPDQLAVAEKFAAMTDRFQVLADKISADENLMSIQELVDTMNTMIDAVNEDDALFADPKNLTPDVLNNLEDGILVGDNFIKEIEAMIHNYQGKKTITIAVEIVNDTGVEIHGLAMSPANSTEWGGDMLDTPLAAGTSGVTDMTFTEDTLVWDLLAADSEGTELTFMGIDFTGVPMEGTKLVLSATADGNYLAAFA